MCSGKDRACGIRGVRDQGGVAGFHPGGKPHSRVRSRRHTHARDGSDVFRLGHVPPPRPRRPDLPCHARASENCAEISLRGHDPEADPGPGAHRGSGVQGHDDFRVRRLRAKVHGRAAAGLHRHEAGRSVLPADGGGRPLPFRARVLRVRLKRQQPHDRASACRPEPWVAGCARHGVRRVHRGLRAGGWRDELAFP